MSSVQYNFGFPTVSYIVTMSYLLNWIEMKLPNYTYIIHTLLQTTAKTVQKGFSCVSGSATNPANDFTSLSGSQHPHLHKESGEIGLTFCSDPGDGGWLHPATCRGVTGSFLFIPTKWVGEVCGMALVRSSGTKHWAEKMGHNYATPSLTGERKTTDQLYIFL